MKHELKNSYTECKKLYRDIIFGYSEVRIGEFKQKAYIKHLDEFDAGRTDREYEDYIFLAKERGLKTEKDALKFIIDQDLWTQEKEDKLISSRERLSTLESTKKKLIIKSQLSSLEKEIKPVKDEVYLMSHERSESMGLTAEAFASKKINEFMVQKAFFKDKELSSLLYDEEEFDVLDSGELSELMETFAKIHMEFKDDQLKLISVCPFFMNLYSLCGDDAYSFFDKPVVLLTNFQSSLLANAKYMKSLISNSKPAPDEYYQNPLKLTEWYELQDKTRQVKDGLSSQGDAGGTSIVGASKEELKGLEDSEEESIDLAALSREKGGLSFDDLMDLHGL
tara:strand:- start:3248 stop:4258 length:1011 start_codon:yes stop_codon:yes gene_type:complete